MLSKNIMCSSKATVNTVLIVFGALGVLWGAGYLFFLIITSSLSELLNDFLALWIQTDEIIGLIWSIIWLLFFLIWMAVPLLLLVYFFHRPQEIHLYKDSIYIKSIGDIPLNKITSFDTPIFDYPDGKMPRLHIRRKWRLPLRLATVDEQESFRRLIYQFVDNIQKLPEHERPKFKTIHGSIIARLFGVSILVAMTIATFFALRIGHIPGTLILAWSAAIPIALLFIKGQRTP